MKDETGSVAIKEFVGLKPKLYSFLVDDNSEHKKKKLNKIVVGKITMNKIQSKNHILGTHETKKNFLALF